MSLREAMILMDLINDRMGQVPVSSSRFKAGLIVCRRLRRQAKEIRDQISDYQPKVSVP